LFAAGRFEAKLLVAQDVLVHSADIQIGRLMGKTISLQHPGAGDALERGQSDSATSGCFAVEACYADNAFNVDAGTRYFLTIGFHSSTVTMEWQESSTERKFVPA